MKGCLPLLALALSLSTALANAEDEPPPLPATSGAPAPSPSPAPAVSQASPPAAAAPSTTTQAQTQTQTWARSPATDPFPNDEAAPNRPRRRGFTFELGLGGAFVSVEDKVKNVENNKFGLAPLS